MTRARFEERAAPLLPGLAAGAPDPARVRAGREGLVAGFRWERRVDASIRLALGAGLLRAAWQCGRPVIGLGPDGAPVYGRGAPDFVAVARDGRAVVVEAKSTAGARLPLAMVAAHQADALDAVARAGGVALLAVELRGLGAWCAPWRSLRWAGPRGGASVGPEELEGHALSRDPAGFVAPFLRGGRR